MTVAGWTVPDNGSRLAVGARVGVIVNRGSAGTVPLASRLVPVPPGVSVRYEP